MKTTNQFKKNQKKSQNNLTKERKDNSLEKQRSRKKEH